MQLPKAFTELNQDNVRGGVEYGFMSTTTDKEVALTFAKDGDRKTSSTLVVANMGMVDRGAPVKWCSQFPDQEEILFAPLTGLQVVGAATAEGTTIVVNLRLNCNLHDLTIEQVIAKMKMTHISLVDTMKMDMLSRGFSQQSLGPLQAHLEQYQGRDGQWFISAENYKQATNDALDAKLEVCAQLLHASVQEDR